ncbi:hypothetical protein E4U14_005756 [Claviceps sp. LM454 group G7]|nr:hypothetical protein E4U14_005756 [Claviceps sp. LM454 group G7]
MSWQYELDDSYPTIIAEIYSNFLNGAYFNWISSPAATELEVMVLDWLAQELNLPECFKSKGSTRGGGVLHGSAVLSPDRHGSRAG